MRLIDADVLKRAVTIAANEVDKNHPSINATTREVYLAAVNFLKEVLDAAPEVTPADVAQSQWISVGDQMPPIADTYEYGKFSIPVMAWDSRGILLTGHFSWSDFSDKVDFDAYEDVVPGRITHWIPEIPGPKEAEP